MHPAHAPYAWRIASDGCASTDVTSTCSHPRSTTRPMSPKSFSPARPSASTNPPVGWMNWNTHAARRRACLIGRHTIPPRIKSFPYETSSYLCVCPARKRKGGRLHVGSHPPCEKRGWFSFAAGWRACFPYVSYARRNPYTTTPSSRTRSNSSWPRRLVSTARMTAAGASTMVWRS